jgi:hypothetical protein
MVKELWNRLAPDSGEDVTIGFLDANNPTVYAQVGRVAPVHGVSPKDMPVIARLSNT